MNRPSNLANEGVKNGPNYLIVTFLLFFMLSIASGVSALPSSQSLYSTGVEITVFEYSVDCDFDTYDPVFPDNAPDVSFVIAVNGDVISSYDSSVTQCGFTDIADSSYGTVVYSDDPSEPIRIELMFLDIDLNDDDLIPLGSGYIYETNWPFVFESFYGPNGVVLVYLDPLTCQIDGDAKGQCEELLLAASDAGFVRFSVKKSRADLIIESLTHWPENPTSEDTDPITFTAVVKNIGASEVGPSVLYFRVGGETVGKEFAIPALAPGSTHTIGRSADLTIPRGYDSYATADVRNEVFEVDETNNAAEDHFVVWDATPPVLSIDTISAPQDGFLPALSITPSSMHVLGASPVQFSGTVADNRNIPLSSNVTVDINDLTVPVDDAGNWTAIYPLSAGANLVRITAADIAGNSSGTNFQLSLDPDLDDDGIHNSVDTMPDTSSDEFADTALGGSTSGLIIDRGEQILQVKDNLEYGVSVHADLTGGTTPAAVSACGDRAQFTLTQGDEVIVICGSVTFDVNSGPVEVYFNSISWIEANATLETGDSLTFEPADSSFTAPADNASTVVVLIDGIEFPIIGGTTFKLAVAKEDSASMYEDTSAAIDVLANDSTTDTTKVISYTDGSNGTVTADPEVSILNYTPYPNFCGTDSFEYTLNDATSRTNTATVNIDVYCVNDAPIVGEIAAPLEPVQVNNEVYVKGVFNAVDGTDTHTATWYWGDGELSAGTVDEANGAVTGAHTYTGVGVYTLKLEVTDQDGESDFSTFRSIVVFDPSVGFVTGGGWFDSPAGAYTGNPTATGKANFGFVTEYKKGATIPTGNAEFQFKAGNLNFHSYTYEWLVVTGSDYANFKGQGTINGHVDPSGDLYKFKLWAGDGNPDTFRIKIWFEDIDGNETIVYDNGSDQAIRGGSIVVHE